MRTSMCVLRDELTQKTSYNKRSMCLFNDGPFRYWYLKHSLQISSRVCLINANVKYPYVVDTSGRIALT